MNLLPFLIAIGTLCPPPLFAHVAQVMPYDEAKNSIPPMHFDAFGFLLPGDYAIVFDEATGEPKAIYDKQESQQDRFAVPFLPLYIGSKSTKASIIGAFIPRESLVKYDGMGKHTTTVSIRSSNPCQRTKNYKEVTEQVSTGIIRQYLQHAKVPTSAGELDLLIYEMSDGNVLAIRSDYPLKENVISKSGGLLNQTCTHLGGGSYVKESSFGFSLGLGGLSNVLKLGPLQVGVVRDNKAYFEYIESEKPIWERVKFNSGKGKGLLNFTLNMGQQPVYFSRDPVYEIGLANLLNKVDLLFNGQSSMEIIASFSQFTFQFVDVLANENPVDPQKFFKGPQAVADYSELFEHIEPQTTNAVVSINADVFQPNLRIALEEIQNRSNAVKKELEWRKALAPTVQGTLVYGEEDAQILIQEMCDHISGSINLPLYFYPKCQISATYIPGAWAYPGGHNIFISAGALASLGDVDSLLFVLSNAFAHVITRDGSKNIDHLDPIKFGNNLLKIVESISVINPSTVPFLALGGFLADFSLTNYKTNEDAGIYNHFKTLVPTLGLMAYTDEQEIQAQKHGFQIALAAGASPETIYQSWKNYESDMQRILGVYPAGTKAADLDKVKPKKIFSDKTKQLYWDAKPYHEAHIVEHLTANESLMRLAYQVDEIYMIKDGQLSANRPKGSVESEYKELHTYFRGQMNAYRDALAVDSQLWSHKQAIAKRFFTPGFRILEYSLLAVKQKP